LRDSDILATPKEGPIKGIISHIIVVSPLEHQEECSKEITSRRAKSGSWERIGVALCKD
jgi:hypothetical protein